MQHILTFDASIYSVLAVEKACYRHSDRLSCNIRGDVNQCIVEVSSLRDDMSVETFGKALRELQNEVLDQSLREKIKTETEPVRNLILAYAFSKTGLIANNGQA